MIWVLYAVEAVLSAGLVALVGRVGLSVWRACVEMPLWLVAVAAVVGFVVRLVWQWSLLSWVVGLHGTLRRRIEER